MVLALRTHLKIFVERFFPDDLAAGFALQPQAFRAYTLFPVSTAFKTRFLPVEPRHSEHIPTVA
jgi:hypothetical protein